MRPKRKKAGAAVAQNVRPWLDSGWRDRDANWRSRTDGPETPKEPRANEREEKERDRRKGKGKEREGKRRKERKERKERKRKNAWGFVSQDAVPSRAPVQAEWQSRESMCASAASHCRQRQSGRSMLKAST